MTAANTIHGKLNQQAMHKYSKLITGFFFLFFISSAFGQLSLQQQDSIAKSLVPIQDKAVVFVIRPTAYAFAIRDGCEMRLRVYWNNRA